MNGYVHSILSHPAQHHSTLLIGYSLFPAWKAELWQWVTDQAPGKVTFRLVNNYVAHCYLLLGNKIWPKLSKNFQKTTYIFRNCRFLQPSITWPESPNSELHVNIRFYLGICGNRKLCFTQYRRRNKLRTTFWYLSWTGMTCSTYCRQGFLHYTHKISPTLVEK